MLSLRANPKHPGDWKERHNAAVAPQGVPSAGNNPVRVLEQSVVAMLHAWGNYADAHLAAYDSKIGDDGVLGEHWKDAGLALRGLLNGDVGPRLDCGTLDAFILDTLTANGVSTEGL